MTIDDCEAISRALSPVLDVADPVRLTPTGWRFRPPGIDRPLVRRVGISSGFAGHQIKVGHGDLGWKGRRRFPRASLLGALSDAAHIRRD